MADESAFAVSIALYKTHNFGKNFGLYLASSDGLTLAAR